MRALRRAGLGGLVALALAPGLATAQDGQQPVEKPVTNPRTNKENPRAQTSTPRPTTSAEVLPPVPATASDPAPPGTRAVRVDRPTPGTPAPSAVTGQVRGGRVESGPDAAAALKAAGRPVPGVGVAEGIVTHVERPGKTVQGELLRISVDPSQDWISFTTRGAIGVPVRDRAAGRDESARDRQARKDEAKEKDDRDEARKDEDQPKRETLPDLASDAPKPLEMVITNRSYIYTHARTPDGVDLYGASTASSPLATQTGVGVTGRAVARPAGEQRTNFTNIKEGSFVTVRYRKVGDLNEVLNLSLIELPMNSPDEASPTTTNQTGSAANAIVAPERGRTPAGTDPAGTTTTPVRVPRVPATPTGPAGQGGPK